MPSKRDVLTLLTRDELLAVVDRFELAPPDRRAKDGLVETVAEHWDRFRWHRSRR